MSVRVEVRERLYVSGLPLAGVEALEAAFSYKNPKYYKTLKMGFKAWREPAVIKAFRHEKDGVVSVPRGGWSRVCEVAARLGLPVEQRAVMVERPLPEALVPAVEPRWYQEEAIRAVVECRQGVVKMPTAAGKTFTGLLIAARVGQRALFVVNNKILHAQWIKAARQVFPGLEPGVVQAGKVRIAPITVAMQQTLARVKGAKLAELFDQFGMVLADECQGTAAPTCQRVIDQAPCLYRVGVSADQTRTDRKEFLIRDAFGDVIYEVPRSVIAGEGHIVEPSVMLVPTAFEAPWYRQAKLDGLRADFTRLEAEMAADDARTRIGVEIAVRAHAEGRSVVLLVARREHAAVVRAMLGVFGIDAPLMIGGEKGFEENREAMGDGRLRCAVGTVDAVGTGLDMPAVNDAVLLAPVQSRQPVNQIKGRICRTAEGKRDARFWVLYDVAVFGLEMAKHHRAWSKSCSVVAGDGSMIPVREWITQRVRKEQRRDGDAQASG